MGGSYRIERVHVLAAFVCDVTADLWAFSANMRAITSTMRTLVASVWVVHPLHALLQPLCVML